MAATKLARSKAWLLPGLCGQSENNITISSWLFIWLSQVRGLRVRGKRETDFEQKNIKVSRWRKSFCILKLPKLISEEKLEVTWQPELTRYSRCGDKWWQSMIKQHGDIFEDDNIEQIGKLDKSFPGDQKPRCRWLWQGLCLRGFQSYNNNHYHHHKIIKNKRIIEHHQIPSYHHRVHNQL